MVRAVFDGLALAARDCYAEMGPLPGRVRLTGGAARSAALRRILGGALGASIQTSEREEAGAAGVAMIAAVSLGIYPSMADCVRDWVTPYQRSAESADETLARRYDALFPAYKQSRLALRPVWHALSHAAGTANQQERPK
jgi:erythritol kinase (D-erythritol 1-phosphate-forming)